MGNRCLENAASIAMRVSIIAQRKPLTSMERQKKMEDTFAQNGKHNYEISAKSAKIGCQFDIGSLKVIAKLY